MDITFQSFIEHIQDFTELENNTISINNRLREDLLLDSLDIMNLIVEISEKYTVVIVIDELAENPTIGGLWDAINKTL